MVSSCWKSFNVKPRKRVHFCQKLRLLDKSHGTVEGTRNYNLEVLGLSHVTNINK